MATIHKYGFNVHSQNSEDGIIKEALSRIKPELQVAVEFGGADGWFCSNTANLRREKDWKVYMYDLNEVTGLVERKMITTANVNELPTCSVLSIDIDGEDMEVWAAYNGTPDIVIIEINSSLRPDAWYYTPKEGANYTAMKLLGESKGYFLLCHTGNLIFVLNEHRHLFPDADPTFKTDWL